MTKKAADKNGLGSGLLLLLLSLAAIAIFFVLKPKKEGFTIPEDKAAMSETQKREAPVREKHTYKVEYLSDSSSPSNSKTNASANSNESAQQYGREEVVVVRPGRIELTEEQMQALKAGGSGWSSNNGRARAILDSIPPEAFTDDW